MDRREARKTIQAFMASSWKPVEDINKLKIGHKVRLMKFYERPDGGSMVAEAAAREGAEGIDMVGGKISALSKDADGTTTLFGMRLKDGTQSDVFSDQILEPMEDGDGTKIHNFLFRKRKKK